MNGGSAWRYYLGMMCLLACAMAVGSAIAVARMWHWGAM